MLSTLTLSISKQKPSKGQFMARIKLTAQPHKVNRMRTRETEWWGLNMMLSHSQFWGLTTLSATTVRMVPGAPLTEGFCRFREKQYTPNLKTFDHQLSPATGQDFSGPPWSPPWAPCCSPEGLTAYFPRVLQPCQDWRRKNKACSSWMPFREQLFGNCRERKIGKDFQYFPLKA